MKFFSSKIIDKLTSLGAQLIGQRGPPVMYNERSCYEKQRLHYFSTTEKKARNSRFNRWASGINKTIKSQVMGHYSSLRIKPFRENFL